MAISCKGQILPQVGTISEGADAGRAVAARALLGPRPEHNTGGRGRPSVDTGGRGESDDTGGGEPLWLAALVTTI